MIKVVSENKLKIKLQNQFVRELKAVCTNKINCIVGFPGGSRRMNVYYSKNFNFWFTSENHKTRYWNAFGFGKPDSLKNNSITVEINIPHKPINRNVGGTFGVENEKEYAVLHRGKIGGGRIGIGKSLFFAEYRDNPIVVNDDGKENEFCLIGLLGSKLLPRQISNFVSEVHRIKNLPRGSVSNIPKIGELTFVKEKSGTSIVNGKQKRIINRTHGIVVNELARQLELNGYQIGKDGNRDLYIHNRNKIVTLFEIKRSSSTSDLYSAVGQLLLYNMLSRRAKMIAVLPSKLDKNVEKRLLELQIHIMYYKWNNGSPTFPDLNLLI